MNTTKKIIKRVEHDLKPHNVATIEKILEFYKTERKCCAIQATGTGKTFLILRLLEIYNDEGKSAIIFAPNREIIKQTKKRMKKFGLNNATFYTYQKLARMTDEEISTMKFDLIVCDELHRTGAKTWGQKFEVLVNSHTDSKVFGVTATPLRCADGRDMAEEYFDSNKACDISLAEALVREIIPVMPLYVSALYTFEEEYQNMSEKIEKANNSMEEKLELQKELLAAKQQLEKANGVPEIIKKYITNYNGKYLVFCKDKKHLYAMKDVVIGWFREAGYDGEIFEYPYYSDSSAVRKNLENFENNKEDGLKLLFIIDKLNEGLHLDEVHGCILLRTTVSNIIYYQQIGRAIDAGSTEQRVILDLVSNFNSLKSFNLKKELEQKVKERRNGNFSECSDEFELGKFEVNDLVQECVDVFNGIDNKLISSYLAWEEWEDSIIIELYNKNKKEMYSKLINRTPKACEGRATKLGVIKSDERKKWTEEEILILKEYYPKEGGDVYLRLDGRTKTMCRTKAMLLGIECDKKGTSFTKKEDEILKKYYPKEGEKSFTRLNERTSCSCRKRVRKLNLTVEQRTNYTKEEDDIIRKNYPLMGYKCYKLLQGRTKNQVVGRAIFLGINSNTKQSKYKYVRYDKKVNKWCVMIKINGNYKTFGYYTDEDEAGRVAMEKAKEYGKAI